MPSHISIACRAGYFAICLLLLAVCGFVATARADSAKVMVIGASNAAGVGVGASAAWPALLEGMLKAKGYDVNMTVNATPGLTSAGIVGLAAGIPAGTQAVLFDTGHSNDRNRGVSDSARAANIGEIASAIRAHAATPVEVSYKGIPPSLRQSDGVHLTPAGHAKIAAGLLPRVIAAIGKRH